MEQGSVQYASDGATFYLRFCGDVRLPWCPSFESFCEKAIEIVGYSSLVFDLNSAQNLDSTTLGTLAKVALRASHITGQKARMYCVDDSLIRLLQSMGLQNVIDILPQPLMQELNYRPIDFHPVEEGEMHEAVISAHEQLMAIEEKNRSRFEGLVNTLRSEAGTAEKNNNSGDKSLNNK